MILGVSRFIHLHRVEANLQCTAIPVGFETPRNQICYEKACMLNHERQACCLLFLIAYMPSTDRFLEGQVLPPNWQGSFDERSYVAQSCEISKSPVYGRVMNLGGYMQSLNVCMCE